MVIGASNKPGRILASKIIADHLKDEEKIHLLMQDLLDRGARLQFSTADQHCPNNVDIRAFAVDIRTANFVVDLLKRHHTIRDVVSDGCYVYNDIPKKNFPEGLYYGIDGNNPGEPYEKFKGFNQVVFD